MSRKKPTDPAIAPPGPSEPPAPDDDLLRLSMKFVHQHGYFAGILALARDGTDQSLADQADALDLTLDGLGYLAMCKVPRTDTPEIRSADLAQVSGATGVPVPMLERLLAIRADEVDVYAHLDCDGVRRKMEIIEAKYDVVEAPSLTAQELETCRINSGLRMADFGDAGTSVWVGDRPAADLISELRRLEPTRGDV